MNMKRIISLVLAVIMVFAVFAGCAAKEEGEKTDGGKKDGEKVEYKTNRDIKDIVSAVTNVLSYDGLVSEILYKENDPDEMVKWLYGVVDINASSHLKDYAITMPTDYNNTLAVLVFDDDMTEADYEEVKETVKKSYIEMRKSSLQMYMPEEYEHVKWQLEHTEAIWRQYNNVLVLCEYNSEEPTAAWDALEALFTR